MILPLRSHELLLRPHVLTGYPPLQITWRRRDGPMPPQHFTSGGVLEIPDIRAEYQGEYVCLVRNQYGSAEKVTLLTVQGMNHGLF